MFRPRLGPTYEKLIWDNAWPAPLSYNTITVVHENLTVLHVPSWKLIYISFSGVAAWIQHS